MAQGKPSIELNRALGYVEYFSRLRVSHIVFILLGQAKETVAITRRFSLLRTFYSFC